MNCMYAQCAAAITRELARTKLNLDQIGEGLVGFETLIGNIAPHYLRWETRNPIDLLLEKLGNHALEKTITHLFLAINKLTTKLDANSQYLLPEPQPWVWYCTESELVVIFQSFHFVTYLTVTHKNNYLVFFHPVMAIFR